MLKRTKVYILGKRTKEREVGIGKNILLCTGATLFVRGGVRRKGWKIFFKKTGPSTCISYLWSKKTMESVKSDVK
jgi:site-specific recombinase XerC